MGTTLTGLQAGSNEQVLVVAIQGFPYLLTNAATTASAVTAWSGTDWTQALGGLFVAHRHEQSFNPWQPFQGGGQCSLRVLPTTAGGDVLGTAMGKTSALPETEITADIDRLASTFNVKRADDFTAAPAEAYIGNECFAYSAKTSTTFTTSSRGRYSPFGDGEYTNTNWALEHRIATYDQYTPLVPVVTQARRDWKGAWVGVWLHRVVGGVLDVKAQAQCIYAGVIDEIGDDVDGTTVIHCRHVLDVIKDTTICRDQYRARLGEGIYLAPNGGLGSAPLVCSGYDSSGTSQLVANGLYIVDSGAAGANQINAGYWSPQALTDKINTWFDSERAAGRLNGFYSLSLVAETNALGQQVTRTVMNARFSSASTVNCSWNFTTNGMIGQLLGTATTGTLAIFPSQPVAGSTAISLPFPTTVNYGTASQRALSEETGTFFDQQGYIPDQFYPALTGRPLGIFLVGGKQVWLGRVLAGALVNVWVAPDPAPNANDLALDAAGTMEIVQVYAINWGFAPLMKAVFKSTGTTGFNDAGYDILASGLGLALPGQLMINSGGTDRFSDTLDALPGSGVNSTMWLLKPTKFSEVFTGDHVLRGSHLVFRNGCLEWQVWSTPVASLATVTLSESNKAEPAGNIVSQKSVSLEDAQWAKAVVKISYDWEPFTNTYRNSITLQDRVAIAIQGGLVEEYEIKVRNAGSGQSAINAVKLLLGGTAGGDIGFAAKWIPFASRPVRKITRSIAPMLYESVCPGDIAVVTDSFARDPATGARGTVARPGIILRHSASYGGLTPGSSRPDSPAGEVDVLVMPVNRATIWSPGADLDETVSGGGFSVGYNSGTLTLRCKAHSYSISPEGADASNFATGDKIYITACDPAIVGAPVQWARTVASVSGNDIVITAALAVPAFDAALTYRITSQPYTTAQTTQETDAYQADHTDGMIQNVSASYQYGLAGLNAVTPTAASHTDGYEYLNTTTTYGDGAALDVAAYTSLARTINNLTDHRTAHQSPALGGRVLDNKAGGASYQLLYMAKRFFGIGHYTGNIKRYAYASVWFRSATGAATSVRVTLSKNRITYPGVTSFVSPSTAGYVWTLPYSQGTATTSSTTWSTSSEIQLDLANLDAYGCGWISIEVSADGEFRGLAQLIERERIAV